MFRKRDSMQIKFTKGNACCTSDSVETMRILSERCIRNNKDLLIILWILRRSLIG